MALIPTDEIEEFLRTGKSDICFDRWPGANLVARATRGKTTLVQALVATIRERQERCGRLPDPPVGDVRAFARRKVEPMVKGLFPRDEQDVVLDRLADGVVFVTPANIERIVAEAGWLHTAWDLANLYLGGIGAELLAEDAPRVVGLSEETTCYVSLEYFAERHRFADFIVHEAAHVFHICKRRTIGLPETRTREWLLDIAFRRRELFAYACETYGRVVELGRTGAERRALLDEVAHGPMPNDETVEPDEFMDVLREAIGGRNGWKRILGRCGPPRANRVLRRP